MEGSPVKSGSVKDWKAFAAPDMEREVMLHPEIPDPPLAEDGMSIAELRAKQDADAKALQAAEAQVTAADCRRWLPIAAACCCRLLLIADGHSH